MSFLLSNSRDINQKFLFGHFMMKSKDFDYRIVQGPCYGRVNTWCSDKNAAYDKKLERELDYMEQVGCYGYMIELCAHTSKWEPKRWRNTVGSSAWFSEVKEKYNTLLDLIRKHRKMWLIVSIFNGNAWKRGVGFDSSAVDKIINIVASAGSANLLCVCPVSEPYNNGTIIQKAHSSLGSFRLLKFNSSGDSSTSYWQKYATAIGGDMKKTLYSSDEKKQIAYLCGNGSESHPWVPPFPDLDKGINYIPESEKPEEGEESEEEEEEPEEGQIVFYDYRGVPGRTSSFSRNCLNANATAGIYYAWDYNGNHDGVKGGDSHCKPAPAIDVYAICGMVVGYDKSIPSAELDARAKALVNANGGSHVSLV